MLRAQTDGQGGRRIPSGRAIRVHQLWLLGVDIIVENSFRMFGALLGLRFLGTSCVTASIKVVCCEFVLANRVSYRLVL